MMKVFLVDDEIAIRENLRNSFPWEEKGYQLVGEAPDGEMALPMVGLSMVMKGISQHRASISAARIIFLILSFINVLLFRL